MKITNEPFRTKLFANGHSMAVRLPKSILPSSREVEVMSCGNTIVIRPANDIVGLRDAAAALRDSIDGFSVSREPPEDVEAL